MARHQGSTWCNTQELLHLTLWPRRQAPLDPNSTRQTMSETFNAYIRALSGRLYLPRRKQSTGERPVGIGQSNQHKVVMWPNVQRFWRMKSEITLVCKSNH